MDVIENLPSKKRLIDANALIKEANADGAYGYVDAKQIADAPTVDAVEVVHGRWIDAYPDIEPDPMLMYGICSECGFEQAISKYLNYCPNCGAKMDEDIN